MLLQIMQFVENRCAITFLNNWPNLFFIFDRLTIKWTKKKEKRKKDEAKPQHIVESLHWQCHGMNLMKPVKITRKSTKMMSLKESAAYMNPYSS